MEVQVNMSQEVQDLARQEGFRSADSFATKGVGSPAQSTSWKSPQEGNGLVVKDVWVQPHSFSLSSVKELEKKWVQLRT